MYLSLVTYESIKCTWGSLSLRALYQHFSQMSSTPEVIRKPPHCPHKVAAHHINTPNPLTFISGHLKILAYTSGAHLCQLRIIRHRNNVIECTLELDVLSDFDPHQLDWEKLFKLEPAEHCDAYVEDLSRPDRW
jgi:hypothetical protein